MPLKIKGLFDCWAYLDHTYDRKQTYFGRYQPEIGLKNLNTLRVLATFSMAIGVFVIVSSYPLFPTLSLRILCGVILAIQAVLYAVAGSLQKKGHSPRICTFLSAFCLMYMLAFGGYIGTPYSLEESAAAWLLTRLTNASLYPVTDPQLQAWLGHESI